MNKDTVTHIYRISVVVILIYIAVLLEGIRHNNELNSMSTQNVRVVNSENRTTIKEIQDVRIINSTIPIVGEVSINGGFNGVPVHITNDGGIFGPPIPVKVAR